MLIVASSILFHQPGETNRMVRPPDVSRPRPPATVERRSRQFAACVAVVLLSMVLAAPVPALATDDPRTTSATLSHTCDDGETGVAAWGTTAPRTQVANATALRAGTRSDGAFWRDDVKPNDTLVLAITDADLSPPLPERGNVTAEFREYAAGENASFEIVQTNPSPERRSKALDVLDSDATTVVADAPNDTYYLVVDLATVPVVDEHDDSIDRLLLGGDEYQVNLTVDGEPREVCGVFDVRDRDAAFQVGFPTGDDHRWLVPPESNVTVEGTTTVRPDQRLTVVVELADGTTRTRTADVRESGGGYAFSAGVDLADLTDGTRFTVDVRHDGESLLYRPAEAEVRTRNATVSVVETDGTGEYRYVEVRGTLSHGGFVVLHDGAVDGEVVASSSALPPGDYRRNLLLPDAIPGETVDVVAVPHEDTDADGEFDPATDAAYGTGVPDATDEATARATVAIATPTDSGTPGTAGATATLTDANREDAGGQPGFGTTAALLALLAVLAMRTRGERSQ